MRQPTADSLTLDSAYYEQLLARGLDYDQEFGHKEEKTTATTVGRSTPYIKPPIISEPVQAALIALFVGLLAFGLWQLYAKKFIRVGTKDYLPLAEEDTIYGIDFEQQLREAETRGDYYQCVRLGYLRLLRQLHDTQRIYWNESKTTRQYVEEMDNRDFATLTHLFVRVRYGNYPADDQMYDEVKALAASVLDTKTEKEEAQ